MGESRDSPISRTRGQDTLVYADVKGLIRRFDDFSDGYETFTPLKENRVSF